MCIYCLVSTVFYSLYKVLLVIIGVWREVEVENEAENDEQSYAIIEK